MERSRWRRWAFVALAAGLVVSAACGSSGVERSTDGPGPTATSVASPGPSTSLPSGLTPVERPVGAGEPGTAEWYRAPAGDGYDVTLGVYRPPASTAGRPSITVLILPGGDGLRRMYEDLAQRFANAGFIAVLGAWYEHDEESCAADAIHCVDAPPFTGMNADTVRYIDALVAATDDARGVRADRVVLVGHSYGAGVALLRAAGGRPEPVVSSSGLVSRVAIPASPLPTDQFAADVAGSIRVPVLVVDGEADPITPPAMADAFVAAMPADNPATTVRYVPPAGHALPWQSESLPDRPGVPLSSRFVEDVGAWIRARLG